MRPSQLPPSLPVASTLAILLLLAAGCTPTAGGGIEIRPTESRISQERATAEINVLLKNVTSAAISRDAEALSSFYAPDAQIVDVNGLTVGWESYRAKALDNTLDMLPRALPSSYRTGAATVRVQGNVAWAAFPYTITAEVNGRPTEIFGYGTVTLRHNGGEWQIVQAQTAGRPRRDGDPQF